MENSGLWGYAHSVRRVVSKQKRAKGSKQASAHLVFTSEIHAEDRAAADRLRSRPRFPRVSQVIRGEFPRAREIAFQGHYGIMKEGALGGEFTRQEEAVFVEENLRAKKLCSWYRRKDPRRPGAPGRKEKTGVFEINVSLPTGVSLVLADMVRTMSGEVPELEGRLEDGGIQQLRFLLEEVGKAGMEKVRKLSGYLPIYLCLHPDSEGVLSYHFGLSPVDPATRQLLGISAGGRKGKRGLRLLGDAFMSIHRHAQFVEIPEKLMVLPKRAREVEKRTADWEIGVAMEEKVFSLLGTPFKERADELGAEEARAWLVRVVEDQDLLQLQAERNELRAQKESLDKALKKSTDQVSRLRAECNALKQRIAELERRQKGIELGNS